MLSGNGKSRVRDNSSKCHPLSPHCAHARRRHTACWTARVAAASALSSKDSLLCAVLLLSESEYALSAAVLWRLCGITDCSKYR